MLWYRVAKVVNGAEWPSGGVSGTRWVIRTGAPEGPDGDRYGDVPFAADLATALARFVGSVRVARRDEEVQDVDVVVTLRGLAQFDRVPGAVNILWIISHPELVTEDELRRNDLVYAASFAWTAKQQRKSRVVIRPLLQATNPSRFRPDPSVRQRDGVLFVGTTRGVKRPSVLWALEAGAQVQIHGHGWEPYVEAQYIVSDHLPNQELPHAYASADIVLNDHWSDMAREGFISNRVFDAAASGAVVVSDRVTGLDRVSPTLIRIFDTKAQLAQILFAEERPDAEERAREGVRVGASHSFEARASTIIRDLRRVTLPGRMMRTLSRDPSNRVDEPRRRVR